MIRQIFIFEPTVSPFESDRYYFRIHGPEFARFIGPWLRRYETYRSCDAPPEADRFGSRNGRLADVWYGSPDAFREANPHGRPYTMPHFGWENFVPANSAITIVPAMPTEDFLGIEPTPEERPIIRWCQIFKYPDGVAPSEGEKWYLEVHAREAAGIPGLLKFVSHRTLDDSPLPNPWHRMSELWFEDLATWRNAFVGAPLRYTAPPWGGTLPFVDMVSTFIPYRPDVDFLRDSPGIP